MLPSTTLASVRQPWRAVTLPAAWAGLIAAGAGLETLLLAFIALYTNVPAGYAMPYGLARPAVALFAALWPYPRLALAPGLFAAWAAGIIAGSWLAYLAAAACLRRLEVAGPRPVLPAVVALALLFNLTLVILLPPVHSADIYNYAMYGRLSAAYGLNPYLVSGSAIPAEPAVRLAGWPDETSRYGPAWTLLAAGASAIAGSDPLALALVFKALAAAAALGAAALVFLLARRAGGSGLQALLLFAWNPLVLVETAGNGHNDVVMIALALLGLWLYTRERRLAGVAALTISILIKYLTGLLLVLLLVREMARPRPWRDRLAAVLPLAALAGGVAAACYAPFWAGPANLGRLLFGLAPGLNSLPNATRVLLNRLASAAFAGLGMPPASAERIVAAALQAGFALLLLHCLARVWRAASWPQVTRVWGMLTLVCLVLVYAAQYPWYLISPLAIAAAVCTGGDGKAGKRLLAWTLALGFVFTLFYAWLLPMQAARP